MLRQARAPKVHDWLVTYVVRKGPHAEELRIAWTADQDPAVASAGWALTADRVVKRPEGLDLPGLLDEPFAPVWIGEMVRRQEAGQ